MCTIYLLALANIVLVQNLLVRTRVGVHAARRWFPACADVFSRHPLRSQTNASKFLLWLIGNALRQALQLTWGVALKRGPQPGSPHKLYNYIPTPSLDSKYMA